MAEETLIVGIAMTEALIGVNGLKGTDGAKSESDESASCWKRRRNWGLLRR